MNLDRTAARLHDARRVGHAIDPASVTLASIDQAYALQQAIASHAESPRIGMKIGATLASAIELVALDEPFHAPLFGENHFANGANVPVHADRPVFIEAEFVIELGRDLIATAEPMTTSRVRDATASIRGGLELVGTRFDMPFAANGIRLIADSGSTTATVVGDVIERNTWESLDFTSHPVSLYIDDEHAAIGHSGLSLGGNPFAMAAWLIDHPLCVHRGLHAGDLIYCGSATGVQPVSRGNRLRADFGVLGELTATLV